MNNVINKTIIMAILFSMNAFSQNISLSRDVIDDMKFMVEEEKLARDVYEYLDETWNLRVFNNIKESEQRHMEKLENLLNTNKITYQLSDKKGVFYNEELQKMHNDLVEKGSKSINDALEVGKLIEVTDINDLENAIKNTNDAYIKQVYSNLLRASENHLQAFNRQLTKY
jgi:hypothetical protein